MKKLILATLIFRCAFSFAQLSEGGYPLSYKYALSKGAVKIPGFNLRKLNTDSLKQEDLKNPSPFRYSVFSDVNVDIKKQGLKTSIPEANGDIWQYKISARNAKSIQLIFKKFIVPPGATLFIYNDDYSKIYGAFTEKNMQKDSLFTVADFQGDAITIEYFEPSKSIFKGQVVIGSIGQAYQDIFHVYADEDGYISINCPEGKDWQYQKHAVCIISFRISGSGYLCSGALINNLNSDGTPYFLTANHCISTSASAGTMITYFNYEQVSCNDTNLVTIKSISGGTLLARNVNSDYSLILLSGTPPPSCKPYYAGWDASGQPSQSEVGIHHPNGEPKKISIDYSPAVVYDQPIAWSGSSVSPANTHWEVRFDHGLVYEGSSGSPLFNNKKRIIGQLHGGDNYYKYYGMLSYSWTHSATGLDTLKKFLDPDKTGALVCDGYDPGNNKPDAQFLAEYSNVCLTYPMKFMDISSFNPTTWQWNFTPSTVTYLDGTDQHSPSPVVSFNSPGTYGAKLVVSNANGADSMQVDEMISSGTHLAVAGVPSTIIDSCYCDFDSMLIVGSGADNYHWEFENGLDQYFNLTNISNDSVMVKKINGTTIDSLAFLTLKVSGEQGTCKDTTTFQFPLSALANDNIKYAPEIHLGANGPFTNKCATIQVGEPVPPHNSCTGQRSWCDEYGTGLNIVENSVWFTFVGPSTGKASIASDGMDNELAAYLADSYQDLLNGSYVLVAANDDYSSDNYNPVLANMTVTPGKIYWLQVDGSGGGTEGTFTLHLNDMPESVDETVANSSITIYPQPAPDHVFIESEDFQKTNNLLIQVYSLTGALVYANDISHPSLSKIEINTKSWETGVYIIHLTMDGKSINRKLLR